MYAILIDDELPNLQLLKLMIERRQDVEVIGAYSDPLEAWEAIINHKPDIIFSDIEMPHLNGIDLANRVQALDEDMSVVFVTAYSEYAVEAFDIGAIHYLLKPVTEEGIANCLHRVQRSRPGMNGLSKRWHIRCFGQLEVFAESADEAVRWPTAKSAELFAALVLNEGRAMDKWDLCERLWPEMNSKRMDHNLYSTVNRIRQALREVGAENVILRDSQGYRVDLSQFTCDYIEYKSLLPQYFSGDKLETAKRIVSLHREALLGTADYQWMEAERTQVQSLLVDCLRVLAAHSLEHDPSQAFAFLNRLLEADPCDEKVVATLMRLHAQRRNQAALVQTYETLVKRMKHELDLEPSATTIQLYSDLIASF